MAKRKLKKVFQLKSLDKLKFLFENNQYFRFCVLSLPIILFVFGFIWKPNSAITGDWDYFLQLYEAFRKIVLEYGQFPWWNPWVAGGVPLYANPQFGLVSIQTPLVLLFGSLYGLKMSVVVYYLVGFWGMYLLVNKISRDKLKSILLAYIFCFGGFAAWHLAIGHLTFATYYLVPLLIYLFVNRTINRWGWLWFSLSLAFFINSSPHYIVIQACILLVGIYILDYIRRFKHQQNTPIKQDVISILLASVLSIHKLLFSLQYLQDFPRILDSQKPLAVTTLFSAIFQPFYFGQPNTVKLGLQFGWWEYSAYIGVLMFFIIVCCLFRELKNTKSRNYYCLLCFGIAAICTVIAAGPFYKYAPYSIMLRIPVLASMGVPSRWLGWSSFIILLGLAFYKIKGKVLYLLLGLTVVELFFIHTSVFYRNYTKIIKPIEESEFEQFVDYKADNPNRFYLATLANRGEVRGYEPIIGYDYNTRETKRVGINFGGKIISDNAQIIYWSPNKIIIQRKASGIIELNINPGNYWKVNGIRKYRDFRVTEPNELFYINDPANTIVCEIEPSYSLLIPGVE